jgi:hypothetical protein
MVQESAEVMSMRYIASKAEEQEKRLKSHEAVDQSLKVWSTKI